MLSGLADLMPTASPSKALESYRESIELARTIEYADWSPNALGASPQSPWPAEMRETQRRYSASLAGSVERIGLTLSPEENEELDAAIAQARERWATSTFDAAWAEEAVRTSTRRSSSRSVSRRPSRLEGPLTRQFDSADRCGSVLVDDSSAP